MKLFCNFQKKHKRKLAKIIIAFLLFITLGIFKTYGFLRLILYLVPYFTVGYDVLKKSFGNIKNGDFFDENFLMSTATIGAFLIGEYPEAVFVMLFFQIGDLFESIAVGKSRKSISDLMSLTPDTAHVMRDGQISDVFPEEIKIGETVVVKPGEKIPTDGKIIEGKSTLDTSALTGEAMPLEVNYGDKVQSGCININGALKIQALSTFENSTASKIMELVEMAYSSKAKVESFITRFARYYTPVVVGCALLIGIIPPIFNGGWALWIERALIFLVVSCPCALVISVPLAFFGGIGACSKKGILVKGSNYIDVMGEIKVAIFDKTGTLTKGELFVQNVRSASVERDLILKYAASAEMYSNHPVAKALEKAYNGDKNAESVEELTGYGVRAFVDKKEVYAGNGELMKSIGLVVEPCETTAVYVAVDKRYMGVIELSDFIKSDSTLTIAGLKNAGIKTVMVTGDKKSVAGSVADKLDIDSFHGECMPGDKVGILEGYIKEFGKVAFMGDGINDGPVLARADVGIAMGGLGSDVAIEAADVVIMDDKPSKILEAFRISRKTKTIVMENMVFALGIKLAVMLSGVFGLANMWLAVFADVGVSVIAIINAMRMLKY